MISKAKIITINYNVNVLNDAKKTASFEYFDVSVAMSIL